MQKIFSVSVSTTKRLYDSYQIADRSSAQVTCTDTNAAFQLFERLVDLTANNPFNISCGGNIWKVENCAGNHTLPSICVNCDSPCTIHCSNARKVHYVSTCIENACFDPAHSFKRSGIINSISVLSVLIAERKMPPMILRMKSNLLNVYGIRARVQISLSSAGGVSCGIFKSGYIPTFLDEIRTQNIFGYNISHGEPQITVDFPNLPASTFFSVFCFSVASNGAHMSLSQMLNTGKLSIQTSCCKNVSISSQLSTVYDRTVYSDLVKVSLDAHPTLSINISVKVTPNSINVYPKVITVTKATSLLSFLYVDTRAAVDGAYVISISLIGPSRLTIKFPFFVISKHSTPCLL